jgi:hypothetical protein
MLSLLLQAVLMSSEPQGAERAPRHCLYVSKLGDNTTGRSWASAFRTVQAALDAVPTGGACRIIVRPDTYMEANLHPAHAGASGAYNELIGDADGKLGGGRKGHVVIDSGDPSRGFKSYDWWGPIRATSKGWSPEHTAETFSAIGWDRWKLAGLYVTGGDGGLMFDCTNRVEPFTVIVEDCVSIGRAFGGGVASCLSRPDEPIMFRRCKLWALDWWGDTAAGYVRVENAAMPDKPDVVFEDCALVSPQCALKAGNYGFHSSSRVRAVRCSLIALNFSQPAGTPTDGIIQSVQHGKYLHVELEDCTLMGYKVFGSAVSKDTAGEIGCTIRGSVRAYVQFQQDAPRGMVRLAAWPTDAFTDLAPPTPRDGAGPHAQTTTLVRRDMCEVSPFVWKGRLCLLECDRPASGGKREDYALVIRDVETGGEIARFGEGYSLACAIPWRGKLRVFASRFEGDNWNDVTMFTSSDLKTWASRVVIVQEPGEHLFNSTVCRGPDGFVMAYETNDPKWPAFTAKFARSKDGETWQKVPDALLGTDRYAACPCIRYADGWYYVLYLEHRTPLWRFETYIARSRDLRQWELSAASPVLVPQGHEDGINASDPDIVEYCGKTLLYYSVGDQLTWMNIKRAEFGVGLKAWLKGWFRDGGIPTR